MSAHSWRATPVSEQADTPGQPAAPASCPWLSGDALGLNDDEVQAKIAHEVIANLVLNQAETLCEAWL